MNTYAEYDISEHDPYLIPDSECLKNLLGHFDTATLNEAERRISQQTLAQIIASPVLPTFDLTHLCEIHRRLFRHIYAFAGQVRTMEVSKGGKLFLPYEVRPRFV
ncbi:MAG: hypothetical protein K0U59_09900 [Gammaproteobacteria bacterium]|nr:hypothetical protein [Gammaproteobacteria bacterium]